MKTSFSKCVRNIGWIILLIVVVWSCEPENVSHLTIAQMQAQTEMAAKDNSQIVAATQDVMDLTAGGLAGQGIANGRASSYGKFRGPELDCAPSVSSSFSIDRSHADSVIYSGTLTIDYGNGTSCKDSTEIRRGKIMDSFAFITRFKDSVTYDLTETVTFQGFQKDSVQIDGTFVSKSSSSLVSNLVIQNAKITYSNGTFVSWSGQLTSTLHRGGKEWEDEEENDNSKEITGSISGTSRTGAAFSAAITKPVLFKYSCSRNIPVSGTIEITLGGVVSDIDYGPGTCDKTYTVTTGGKTTEYTFKRHHHV